MTTLSRDEITAGLSAEMDDFEQLIRSIDDDGWAKPSRCEGWTVAEVAAHAIGSMADVVEALWFDFYMHADDIRAAIGRPSEPGNGLRASASHIATELTKRNWGPATIALDGLPEFPVNGGGGRRVEGEPLPLLLAATGRTDPATVGLDASVNLYA